MKTAAIYARVSSDRQREEQTIASQTAALKEMAQAQGWMVPPGWVFEDEGYSVVALVKTLTTGNLLANYSIAESGARVD